MDPPVDQVDVDDQVEAPTPAQHLEGFVVTLVFQESMARWSFLLVH